MLEIVDELTDTQAGKLLKTIIAFEVNGELKELDRELKMVFIPFKHSLLRTREMYDNKCEKNKQNILKRWMNKAKKEGDTKEYERIRTILTNTKRTDSDSDSDSDTIRNDNDIDKETIGERKMKEHKERIKKLAEDKSIN